MTKAFFIIACTFGLFSFSSKLNAQSADQAKDEQAIRAAATAYQNAFNQGDAKTLASMWVDDGEYIDQTGFLLRGRDVIAKMFESFFNQNKGIMIEIDIGTIKILHDDVVSEIGTTRSTAADGKRTIGGRYSIIHVRRNGKWLMLSVHEQPPHPPSNYEKLKDLEWLVGNWMDEQKSSESNAAPVVHVKSYWSVNRNFIIREFVATVDGSVSNIGTQRIGWHAPSKQIRSWAFDSKGGIITGTWTKKGENWTVAAKESLADGQVATATESVKQNDDGSQTWVVTGRAIAGKSLPDESFKLVRFRN